MSARRPAPAEAYAPDPNRAGPNTPPALPDALVQLLTLLIRIVLLCLAGRTRRSRPPSWVHDRPDLPAGSAQALAASVRGQYGNSIAWMCLRRGIGPGHPDWAYLSRTIVAFGGSVAGFRAGAPARGLEWWENPDIIPGMIAETPVAPAATALALLLSRRAVPDPPPPSAKTTPPAAGPALSPAPNRPVLAHAAWRPPTGPPIAWTSHSVTMHARGQSMAGPAVLIRAARLAAAARPFCTISAPC